MDISFANSKLRRNCNEDKRLIRRHGTARAKLIRRRLDDMAAADTLADLKNVPGRYHELTGDREGRISADLDGPYRLIFRPAGEDTYRKADGGLDWKLIHAVCIEGVENTHE